jgi:hypothetical protein
MKSKKPVSKWSKISSRAQAPDKNGKSGPFLVQCLVCGKTFNKLELDSHVQSAHQNGVVRRSKAEAEYLQMLTPDTVLCGICGRGVPKKYFAEHFEWLHHPTVRLTDAGGMPPWMVVQGGRSRK